MTFQSGLWILAIMLAYVCGATEQPQCSCENNSPQVCGSDGKLYANACLLNCANVKTKSNVTVVNDKYCELDLCPCSLKVNPVCGTDGHTYKNICSLKCAKVAKPSLGLYQQGECVRRVKRNRRASSGYQKRFLLERSRRLQKCSVAH